MKVLALDTTTRAGSVAIVEDDRVIDERGGDAARTHAERLPAEILAIADANQTTMDSVDLFVVATGPGSFTGMRIGIATLQGLAFVLGRQMIGVSTLEALAQVGSADLPAGTRVAAWMDGYRRDVFAALYGITEAPIFHPDRLVELDAPSVGDPIETWRRWSSAPGVPALVVGDGAVIYRDLLGPSTRILPAPLLAGAMGRIGAGRARRGLGVHPSAIHPLYVRRPDAEIARDGR